MSDKICSVCKKETWRVSVLNNDWICNSCVQNMIDTFRDTYDVQLYKVSAHSGLLINLEDVWRMTDIVPPESVADASKNPTRVG